MREHDRFEQAVAREAVRAVKPRACDFADREKSGQRSRAICVGDHAAALVVRRGHDGNRLLRDVNSQRKTPLVNRRKMRADEIRRLVADVHKDARAAGALHLRVNRARHDVARCERAARIVAVRKFPAVRIHQPSALAAYGFTDQEAPRVVVEKARRVELDELHVRDLDARAPRNRHAVARRDARVCRVAVHFAAAAGREHHAVGAQREHLAAHFVQHIRADAPIVHRREAELPQRDEIHRHVVFEQSDPRLLCDGFQKRALNLTPRRVARV